MIGESFPLTDLQAAYFVAKAAGGIGSTNYQEVTVEGLDLDRLTGAWRRLVAHHPMLRMRVTTAGEQVIQDEVPAYDIADHRPARLGEHLAEVRAELSRRAYPAGTWPLFDLRVTWCPDDLAIVHLSMDSWVLDGPSAEILMADLAALYLDPATVLEPQPCTFADHVRRLHERRATPAGARQLRFWRDRIASVAPGPRLDAPESGATPAVERLHAELDPATWSRLRAFAAHHRVFPASVVLAGLAMALAPAQAERRFSLLLTHAHRQRFLPGPHRILGPFTTASICQVDDPAGRAAADLVADLDRQICQNLDNQDVCVAGVLADSAGGAPAFPVVFTANLATRPAGPGWGGQVGYASSRTDGVAIECRVSAAGDGGLAIDWDVALPSTFAATLLANFETALRSLGHDESTGLTTLQRVYLAERLRPGAGPWAEGRVYQELDAVAVHPDRLRDTLAELTAASPALHRSWPGWSADTGGVDLAVEDLSLLGPDARAIRIEAIRRGMLAAAGRPGVRIRVSAMPGDRCRVHVATDMAVLDACSILLLYSWLFRAEPVRVGAAAAPAPPDADADGYWGRKVASAPPGPALPQADAPRPVDFPCARRSARLDCWPALVETARRYEADVDAVLVAVFASVLRTRVRGGPFTIVVAVTGGGDRPPGSLGDFTRLCWVTEPMEDTPFGNRVRSVRQTMRADLRHGGGGPITALSRLDGSAGGPRPAGLPPRVVLTSSLLDEPPALPDGVTLGAGFSLTPGVDLDVCAHNFGGLLTLDCDYRLGVFPDGFVEDVFADFQRVLAQQSHVGTDGCHRDG